MEGAQQEAGGGRLTASNVLGTVVRTDGATRQQVLASAAPVVGAFVSLDAPTSPTGPAQVGVVVGVTAVDTLGGRYDAAFEQRPALRDAFDLEVGERATFAHVLVLGTMDAQTPPLIPARLGATVRVLDDDGVRRFHDAGDDPRMAYHGALATEVPAPVLDAVLARVAAAVPDAASYVALLRRESALRQWRKP